MNKKTVSSKVVIPHDDELRSAWKCYGVGNFYAARLWAKKVLARTDAPLANHQQAKSILAMCSVDPWALTAGLAVLLFSLLVAYKVSY